MRLRRRLTLVGLVLSVAVVGAVPTKAGSALTEEEAVYIGQAQAVVLVATHGATEILRLYEAPELSEDAWWTDVAAQFGAWRAAYAVTKDLAPPRSLREPHDLLIEGMTIIDDGALIGLEGAATRDTDLLEEAADRAQDASVLFQEAIEILEGGAPPGGGAEDESDEGGDEDGDQEAIRIEGVGIQVSDPFDLSPGRYRVSVVVQIASFDGFALFIYGPSDFDELLFNETIEGPTTYEGTVVLEVERTGAHYLATENTASAWSVTIEPL